MMCQLRLIKHIGCVIDTRVNQYMHIISSGLFNQQIGCVIDKKAH